MSLKLELDRFDSLHFLRIELIKKADILTTLENDNKIRRVFDRKFHFILINTHVYKSIHAKYEYSFLLIQFLQFTGVWHSDPESFF